jgi:small-conductance mechanosensitive channel
MLQFVGPNGTVQLFGVHLVGLNAENGRKLLFTIIFLTVVWLVSHALRRLARGLARGRTGKRVEFWTNQVIQLVTAVIQIIGVLSIWFNNPTRLATFLGLFSAGIAFALQKVITALAAYFVLLRGRTFNVGDRIKMGGVRGDVIALGFIQTTIMEMGQPPDTQSEDPGMWVMARQYTGRLVTVTNDKIFDEPVYNYSRELPFIWEEIRVGISYTADRARAEQILLDIAKRHTVKIEEISAQQLHAMESWYSMCPSDLGPRVYWRTTDNWLELALRFITRESGVREVKSDMTRDLVAEFDAAGLDIAAGTYEIVGMPPLQVKVSSAEQVAGIKQRTPAANDNH